MEFGIGGSNKLHHLSGLVPSFPLPKETGREGETV